MDWVGGSSLEKGVPGTGVERVLIGEEGKVEHGETGQGRYANVLGKVHAHYLQ